jgi:hypothetical protein
MVMIAIADVSGEDIEGIVRGGMFGGDHAEQTADGRFADAFIAGGEDIFAEETCVIFPGNLSAEFQAYSEF